VLDTGAGGLVIDRETAMKAGATEDQLAHDPVSGGIGIGGPAGGRRHVFKMLLVGKDVYHDVPAFVTDTTDDAGHLHALIGMASLNNHRVWFSYGTETLFLQSLAAAPK
jgi:predicted aspartyl protease